MGFKKWVVAHVNKQQASVLAEECDIDSFIAYLACARGYEDPFSLDEFLVKESDIIDPFAFDGVGVAAERIETAVFNNQKIVILGDYDCDGVTSTAFLYLFLKSLNADVDYIIPNRLTDGYGMNENIINLAAEKKARLIITVDNGIACVNEAELARSLGIDVIITDHHLPQGSVPDAIAVIDPHLQSDGELFCDYAGVGVAFLLALAVAKTSAQELLLKYADLVALGTVADVMPLRHENRVLADFGIKKLISSPNVGLSALLKCSKTDIDKINSHTLAFVLAPRINAAGRLGNAERAVELLICDDAQKAEELAAELNEENKRRRELEHQISNEAREYVLSNKLYFDRVLVVCGQNWHEGVLGIAAARLSEEFSKPVVLLTSDSGGSFVKGSARSVGDFSIFDAIDHCKDLLLHYGGHKKAAGLSLIPENVDSFRIMINKYADLLDMPVPILNIDCRLNPSAVLPDLVRALGVLEPYGAGNPAPVFGLFKMTLSKIIPMSSGKHLRLVAFKEKTAVAMVLFGVTVEEFAFKAGDVLDFAVTLQLGSFQGEEQLNVFVKDIRKSGRDDELVVQSMAAYQTFYSSGDTAPLICFSREEMAVVFRAVRGGADTFSKLSENLLQFPAGKIALMLDVMQELGIINCEGSSFARKIRVIPGAHSDLNTSKIFCRLRG